MPTTITVEMSSSQAGFSSGYVTPRARVTLNGVEIEGKGIMLAATTFRVILFDPSAPPTDPSASLFDEVLCDRTNRGTQNWIGTYRGLYDFVQNSIYSAGDPTNLFFLIASAGLDAGMVPPPSFAEFLFSCGAGLQLQGWLGKAPGPANPNLWISTPANYCFLGTTGLGYDGGFEKYETTSGATLRSTMTISF